jgi:glucose uptake protein
MIVPQSFSEALALTVLTTIFWGSWANTYKGTRNYPFALFYWDYILGVVLCSLVFAFTLGSWGSVGEPFLANLHATNPSNLLFALIGGAIFNVANVLLVAAVDMAGLAIAFPIAIGIAVVEGVVLSYAMQPKGAAGFLAAGVVLALIAVLFDARAYRSLHAIGENRSRSVHPRTGIIVSVISGVLMGGFAPFVARALTSGHAMTPYSVAATFSVGALLCSLVFNTWLMRHPIAGEPVSFAGYRQAGTRNHLLGVFGGVVWGLGGCFNFIAAGYVGVPISYAIGQSAPLIAAGWGVFVWGEFAGAPPRAWRSLGLMALCYVAAIALIALAYNG